MNNMVWLIRAVQWVRNPPSDRRVALVAGLIALALAIVALEWLGWWPDALTLDHGRGGGALRP